MDVKNLKFKIIYKGNNLESFILRKRLIFSRVRPWFIFCVDENIKNSRIKGSFWRPATNLKQNMNVVKKFKKAEEAQSIIETYKKIGKKAEYELIKVKI